VEVAGWELIVALPFFSLLALRLRSRAFEFILFRFFRFDLVGFGLIGSNCAYREAVGAALIAVLVPVIAFHYFSSGNLGRHCRTNSFVLTGPALSVGQSVFERGRGFYTAETGRSQRMI